MGWGGVCTAQTYDPKRAAQLLGTQKSDGGNTLTNRSREENLRALVRQCPKNSPVRLSLACLEPS